MSASLVRNEADLLALADAVLAEVASGEAEVIVSEVDTAVTRFANNAIHQNVADTRLSVRLRLIRDSRVSVAEADGQAASDVAALVAAAERALAHAPPGDPTPLAEVDDTPPGPSAYRAATAATSPETRAAGVATVVERARMASLVAYGAFNTTTSSRVVTNSRGVRRSAQSTQSGLVTVVRGEAGSGYAERHDVDIWELDVLGAAEEVVELCQRNQNAVAYEAGDHAVVLAPYAVTKMLSHLAWSGLSAQTVIEKRSFMRPGEQLMSEQVTLVDDPADAAIFPFPFDYEGVSARPVTFIDGGVCRDVIHDSATARRMGTVSTGHGLPMPNTYGPFASHLAMAAGEATPEELLEAIGDGIYITRFWYVRNVHPLRTIITGMTRDGTFRVRNGKLAEPIRNLRFTQSIVDALAGVRAIASNRRLIIPESEAATLVPAVALGSFTFSS